MISRRWWVVVVLIALCRPTDGAKCDSLKVHDFVNTTSTSDCRLWMDSVPNYGQNGLFVLATTLSGAVLTMLWGRQHYITKVSTSNDFCVWSGSSTEWGDVSGTTLAMARYTKITSVVTNDHIVFYANDNGKLKKINTTDLVTHVAGNGETAANRTDLVQSLARGPLDAKIGDAYQAFVSESGVVFFAVPVTGEIQRAIVRYNPTTSTVTMALPYIANDGTASSYGIVYSIVPTPVSSSADGDLLILSKKAVSDEFQLLRYHAASNSMSVESDGEFRPSVPDRFASSGGLGLPDDRSKVYYVANTNLSPRDTHYVLYSYHTETHKAALATGIGSATGVEPTSAMWADLAQAGIPYGMAFSPDGRYLWMALRSGAGVHLVRVEYRDANTIPLPPIAQKPFISAETTSMCTAATAPPATAPETPPQQTLPILGTPAPTLPTATATTSPPPPSTTPAPSSMPPAGGAPVPATPIPVTVVPPTPVPATPVPATVVPATAVPATPVPSTRSPPTPTNHGLGNRSSTATSDGLGQIFMIVVITVSAVVLLIMVGAVVFCCGAWFTKRADNRVVPIITPQSPQFNGVVTGAPAC